MPLLSVKHLLANLSTEFKYVVIQEVKEHFFFKTKTELHVSLAVARLNFNPQL